MNFLRSLGILFGPSNPLSFTIEHQQQTEWCWSATSVSITRYFNQTSSWQQCTLANATIGRQTCCTDGKNPECNQPWNLVDPLTIVRNFQSTEERRLTLTEVRSAIDDGRPLCLRIEWYGSGGHFVVIYGYSNNTILVADPLFGYSAIEYDKFPDQYQDRGKWTGTYWVQP